MMLGIVVICALLVQDPAPPAAQPAGTDPAAPTAAPQEPAPAQDVPTTPASGPATTEPATGTASPNPESDPKPGEAKPVPAPTDASTVPPVVPSNEPPAAPKSADSIPPITEQDLADVLELAGMTTVSSLEREVKSLQQTLDGLVLADDESVVKIHGAKGSEDDLESFGVDDAVARQVRRLLDEVKSKRAKLALLDLRGASSNNPNDGLRSVAEVGAAAEPSQTTAAEPDAAAGGKGKVPAIALPVAPADDALAGPSPDPQREALIAFRDRDVRTVLELLADTPMLRMKPVTLWAYGSCLMSERRYGDAKVVFTRLKDERDHPQLAHGAQQQLERISFIENALVGQGPSTETKK